ncbi:MAG: hypothetical protein ABI585_08965 [Betaproteobacteria bacterium]
MASRRILSMGASYGSLLAIKLVAAGHAVTLACVPAEVEAFNSGGARVRLPVRGSDRLVEVDSRTLPGQLDAAVPQDLSPGGYDLVVLAMQEPQYRSPGVRELLGAVAEAGVPCMSIMNMPPPPFLARIPKVDVAACRDCYTDFAAWDAFDPALVTLCSPDPQAFRPPGEPVNVLQVRLPTNFKAARFPSGPHTALLHELASGIEAARFDTPDGRIELPVKLKVFESTFVPLAKWSMLLAGNYRCVQADGMRSIKDAVHGDLVETRAVYDWVSELCRTLGAAQDDLVQFEKYANAAQSLLNPSSAARALVNSAPHIERVDRLVQTIGRQNGMRSEAIDGIVAAVDHWIARNRAAAAAAK